MADVLQMNYWQIQAYIDAAEFDRNERLVVHMNVMAVAFGGSAKDRRSLSNTLLGIGEERFDLGAFENIFTHLATPVDADDDPVRAAMKEWAASEFNPDDPAFKVKP